MTMLAINYIIAIFVLIFAKIILLEASTGAAVDSKYYLLCHPSAWTIIKSRYRLWYCPPLGNAALKLQRFAHYLMFGKFLVTMMRHTVAYHLPHAEITLEDKAFLIKCYSYLISNDIRNKIFELTKSNKN